MEGRRLSSFQGEGSTKRRWWGGSGVTAPKVWQRLGRGGQSQRLGEQELEGSCRVWRFSRCGGSADVEVQQMWRFSRCGGSADVEVQQMWRLSRCAAEARGPRTQMLWGLGLAA